jgi:hypothetical protein
LDFVAAGQDQQAAQKAVYPGRRQIGRKPQGQETCQWLTAHGCNVAQAAGEAAVSHDDRRVPAAAKMYVLNAEIGGDKKLKSELEAKDGAIVTNAHFHGFVDGRGRHLPNFPNRTSFSVHFYF